MKRTLMIAVIAIAGTSLALADGGSMGGGLGGSMMGGSGMFVIADDASVLVTEMGMGDGMMDDSEGSDRQLINIDREGAERWRVAFEEGWPMMPVANGDLVLVTLRDDWWMGNGDMGDGGWGHGKTEDEENGGATLLALALGTGNELWRLELESDMMAMPQFTNDGTLIYLTTRDMDNDHVGDGPMSQGDATGSGMLKSSTLIAVDRSGGIVWSLDLEDDHMGGPVPGGGQS